MVARLPLCHQVPVSPELPAEETGDATADGDGGQDQQLETAS